MTDNAKEQTKTTTPYLPFKTFLSSLDTLKNGIPNQIDRSVYPTQNGMAQGQILGAFRFFGLISPDGKPTAELAAMVDEKQRPAHLKKLLEKAYPNLFALGLANASPNSLDAELRKSGLGGDTHEKAKSFFLQAAKFAAVPLSVYLLKVTRTPSAKKRNAPSTKPKPPIPAGGNQGGTLSQTSSMKTVHLAGEIDLFLGASADLFSMASEDRKFVLELLDRIEEYEKSHPVEDESADEPEEEEEA